MQRPSPRPPPRSCRQSRRPSPRPPPRSCKRSRTVTRRAGRAGSRGARHPDRRPGRANGHADRRAGRAGSRGARHPDRRPGRASGHADRRAGRASSRGARHPDRRPGRTGTVTDVRSRLAAPVVQTVTAPIDDAAATPVVVKTLTASAVAPAKDRNDRRPTGRGRCDQDDRGGSSRTNPRSRHSGFGSHREHEPARQLGWELAPDSGPHRHRASTSNAPPSAADAPKMTHGPVGRPSLHANVVGGRPAQTSTAPIAVLQTPAAFSVSTPARAAHAVTSSGRSGLSSSSGLVALLIGLATSVVSPAAAFSGAGGGGLFAFAALCAVLILVVPRLGRRLRLELAEWPPPSLALSLERPG